LRQRGSDATATLLYRAPLALNSPPIPPFDHFLDQVPSKNALFDVTPRSTKFNEIQRNSANAPSNSPMACVTNREKTLKAYT
jgi:hypothetical protein